MVSTSLAFRILATDDGASKVLSTVGAKAGETEARLSLLSKGTHKFGETTRDAFKLAAAGVLGAGLIEGLKSVWEEAEHSQLVVKQTEAVIKSTGGAAHVSAAQVGELATRISQKTAVDDEAIQSGANLLLTFTAVRNEAGKGNNVFDQATQAITDMTAAMNGGVVSQEGLKNQAILVGKALNDPIKGLTALQRVGVTFTASQKDQIAVMVRSGDTLGAQKVILRELSKEFGGSAEAAATGAKRLGVVISNVKEDIGKGLVRAVDQAGNAIADQLPAALAAGSRAFGLIEDPIQRIGHDLMTILVPMFHDAADAVRPLALLVGGTLVGGLHLLADVLDFVASNKDVFVPLAEGALAFVAASKGIALVQTLIRGINGLLETAALKALYAGDAMKAFAAGELAVEAASVAVMAIVSAVAIVIGALAFKHMSAKRAQQEHSDAVANFSQVLRDNNGAINANVVAQRAAELEQKGLLDLAGKAGISLSTYTQATLGNAAAQHTVADALKAAAGSGRLSFDELGRLVDQTGEYSSITTDAAGANIRVATATDTATGSAKNLTAAQKAAATATAIEKQKTDELWASLEKLANVNLDALSTHLAFQQAILGVDGSLKGLDATTRRQTRSLDASTEAGAAARQQLIQNVKAAIADRDAQLARGVGIEHANKTLQTDLGTLRAHYAALGYSKQAVDAIIASLGVFGKQHPVATTTVKTDQAKKNIAELNRELALINGRVATSYIYNYTQDIVTAPKGRVGKSMGGDITGGIPGMDSVPILAMPGERVLTVAENRAYKEGRLGGAVGGGGGTTVTIEHVDVHVHGATGRQAAVEMQKALLELGRSGWTV